MDWKRIEKTIELEQEKYLAFWQEICQRETPSHDKAALDGLADRIADFARSEGFEVSRFPMERCGDFLVIDHRKGAEKKAFFLAHMDTVHEKGKFGSPPVRVEGDRLIGPGVIDCKGGIAMALWSMKCLKECGYPHHLRLMLTSDEEVSTALGGQKELDFIRDSCTGFAAALNCEVGRSDSVVVSRCGILHAHVCVTGKSAHAGIAYFDGASAIREAACKIAAMEEQSRKGDTTYNCGRIEGGGAQWNIVPDRCEFFVDVRVHSMEAIDRARAFLEELVSHSTVEGTSATLELSVSRLPMVENEGTVWLFDKLNGVCESLGYPPFAKERSGGGSDSAYTQQAGVPSLCALGAAGEGCHTPWEWADLGAVLPRTKILTALALSL